MLRPAVPRPVSPSPISFGSFAPRRTLLDATLVALCALGLAGCAGDTTPAPGAKADADGRLRYGSVAFAPCALSEGRADAVEAHCASVQVPEDDAAPNGRKIALAIALIPASGQAEPDPIVFIAGGPGQSILEAYPRLHPALRDARRNRHVLLIDARGTGGSNKLQCDEVIAAVARADAEELSPEALKPLTAACRDRLSKTADLRRYGTGEHIRDLDRVRRALGVDRFNLVGVSYGTRVAQQFAKAYPQHTRTVTLDSVAPNTLVLGQEHARNLDAALRQQFARCRADAACARSFGDPAAALAALRAELRAGGLPPVRYRDPVDGQWRSETPTEGHLGLLLRLYAYQPDAAAMLPWLVHETRQGRYESLLSQARMISDTVFDSLAMGMSLSVTCTEDPEIAPDPTDAGTVMGTEFAESIVAQCAVWPKGERAADFRRPLAGDLPVLAISGEFDPVTPPRYGDEVVKTLRNGRHLVLPGQGHSVLTVGCMPKLFAQFVESADAKALDAACLERLRPSPPFAGNYGWEP